MKIIIIAYRHWQIGRRYRSLALNAKRLGHQVWGFSGAMHGDDDLAIAAFNELGIEAYHGDRLKNMIDQINPDLVCGERYHPRWPVENLGQDWVNKHNKVGFLLNHTVIGIYHGGPNPGSRTHLLVTNKEQARVKTPPEDPGWPVNEVHIMGEPGFDWVTEKFNVAEIRARLNVQPSQPLIGLFVSRHSFALPIYAQFLDEAKRRNWKVALHPHPMIRRSQNNKTDAGFLQPSENLPALRKTQETGALIVADYAPGQILDIRFERCAGFELHAAADCLFADMHDPIWEAYAIKKGCHYFRDEVPALTTDIVDASYEKQHSIIEKVLHTLDVGSNSIEQDPEIVAKWLYKTDGLWWQRALSLAERLKK